MGAPIPNAPTPPTPPTVGLSATTPAASLCGFKFPPPFTLTLAFKLPKIPFPTLPIPYVQLGLSCDLNNPINISAGVADGGGRTANAPPNPDDTTTSDSP